MGECERGRVNANEGGWVNENESGQMGAGEREWAIKSRSLRAGERERGQASVNEGGGATVAATAGSPLPPFFFLLFSFFT